MATARTKGAKNKKSLMKDGTLGGFTIIEVVLVLAIAGLIFMMVFIALPQLQRAQRDTQRRQDIADLQAAITQYQSNNNGSIPDSGSVAKDTDVVAESCAADNKACKLLKTYMNSVNATTNSFVDPDGTMYGLEISVGAPSSSTDPSFDHIIYMYTKAKCDGESVTSSTNKRDFALVYRLEGSGVYCHDNNS